MRKNYVWGALASGLMFMMMNSEIALAQGQAETQETKTVTTEVRAEREAILQKAKEAKELAVKNPSKTYPGLDKYIDGLIQGLENNKYSNPEEALAALDEAAEAIPLLLGTKQTQAVAENHTQTQLTQPTQSTELTRMQVAVGEKEVPKETQQEKPVVEPKVEEAPRQEATHKAPVVKPVQAEAKLADTTIKVEVAEKDDENETANDGEADAVELPKTGEGNKAGVGVLIIAGMLVVAATAGMTVLIVKGKKNA